MSTSTSNTRFETRTGAMLVLENMRIEGSLHNAVASVELTQVYRNAESVNVEALYTFPLPVDAILLHLSVTLNEKRLVGRVTERATAEYEEAVASGNTAVMLEQVEPGLYTMNVGNLLPGERAEVRMRYALPLKWEGSQLRLALPTTVAPRYGDQLQAGVQPHQTPTAELLAEHHYGLSFRVLGMLSDAEIASPSHRIAARKFEQGIEITLADRTAFADRDFVLTLKAQEASQSALTLTSDGDRQVAHAVFRIPEREGTQNIALKILVDCSGSMAGDSMAAARAGAIHALNILGNGDRFSVTAFGSSYEHDPRFKGMLMPGRDDATITLATGYVRQLDATLGGTEMLGALAAVFALSKASDGATVEGGEVLLITDGETWDRGAIVKAARASGHRVFVIGIGSSPSEALAREVAEATGGVAAFVSPTEDIKPVIERQVQRMRTPRVGEASLTMPGEITWQSPACLQGAVFAGDTLHVYCGLKHHGGPEACLALRYADGTEISVATRAAAGAASGFADGDLPRVATAARLREAIFEGAEHRESELAALAVQYQIVSPYTNYILVHVRGEDAARDLPELRQVPHMLAAGWGGVGSVRGNNFFETRVSDYRTTNSLSWDDAEVAAPSAPHSSGPMYSRKAARDRPMFMLADGDGPEPSPREVIERLNARFTFFNPEKDFVRTLDAHNGLVEQGIESHLLEALRELINQGWPEEEVVVSFWMALLSLDIERHFKRSHRRAILRVARQIAPAAALVQWLTACLRDTTEQEWSWQPHAPAPIQAATQGFTSETT